MTLRYCPRCRADVEDAGGFCLLGHRFPVSTEDPIADLRSEVDRAFEKVQLDLSSAFDEQVDEPTPVLASPASSDTAPSVYEQLKTDEETLDEIVESRRDLWRELSEEAPVERNDPILAFSPSPRMEWGPGKTRRRRSKRD